MPRVLHEGSGEQAWWVGAQVECFRCGSVLELLTDDAVEVEPARNQRDVEKAWVTCPVCGNRAGGARGGVGHIRKPVAPVEEGPVDPVHPRKPERP